MRVCRNPASRNDDASITMSIVATNEVCVLVQPNSFSSAGTYTLHA
jgi:hypothetical protein